MGDGLSRRSFVKMAAAAAAGITATQALPTAAEAARSNPGTGATGSGVTPRGPIEVRVTSPKLRYAPVDALSWSPAKGAAEGSISIDTSRRFQQILGFGAALTDAACHNLNRLSPEARASLYHEFFSPAEMGFNACRTCVGSSDYATEIYSYDEGEPDPDLKRFSIARDREYVLPMIRQAREVNPGLFLLASPWSPPGWMKANNSMLGGCLRKRYYATYANYLVKFLQAYADQGVRIDAITSQNEVDTDQDGKMPACLWGQEYEIEFITNHLGPQLAKSGLPTKLWILDHNYNLWGRVLAELEDPKLNAYVDGVAWHGYAGKETAMTRVHEAFADKHAYWTEGGPDYTDPQYLTDWTKWSATFCGILRNWARCIIGWNLALDEKGKPNVGPFSCGGVVTIDSKTKAITRSGQYWAFAHYSRAVRPGAWRIDSQGSIEGLSHVAFANVDGSSALIVTNTGAERKVTVQNGGSMAELAVPADSLTTVTWR